MGERSKCASCTHAHILRGFRESEEVVYCTFPFRQILAVPFRVRECSNHMDKTRPTWEQMEDLAIQVLPTSSAKPAGFRRRKGTEEKCASEVLAAETVNR